MKKILACALAVLAVIAVSAQSRCDSVKVFFNIGQWQFDPALDGNAASMDSFIEKVRVAAETQNLDSIVIRAYASPDGTDRFNKRLAVARSREITDLIENRAGIQPSYIKSYPEGIAWGELRKMVYDRPDVPSREKILDILDNTPVWVFDAKGRVISSRKKQLMDLRGGRPWHWMLEHLFPVLRNSMAVSFYIKADAQEAFPTEDTVVIPDTIATDVEPQPVELEINEDTTEITHVDTVETNDIVEDSNADEQAGSASSLGVGQVASEDSFTPPIYCLALKTNLLYYGALLPNIELEWLINEHWSTALEANVAWWDKSYKNTYRLILGSPEVRYHIKPRARWHGMYVGAFLGGGFFDLCNKKRGYRGSIAMAGVSIGYMWPITSRLSLEAGIGGGYMFSPHYKKYKPLDGHRVYIRTRNLHYIGPLKLKLAIAWRFWDINKPKRHSNSL